MTIDVLDAIATTLHAFRSAGLEPPAAIVLKDWDQGIEFLMAVKQSNTIVITGPSTDPVKTWTDCQDITWREILLMGVKVRWPAKRFAAQDGTQHWV